MRVMVIVPASPQSEEGQMPSPELFAEMGKFNEELAKAGVILAAEGLAPTSKAKRVRFDGKKRSIIDGPFAESKEMIAGFWLWQVRSMEEAVEWLKKAPFGGGVEIEIRPVNELEEVVELTPELREQGKRIAEGMKRNAARR